MKKLVTAAAAIALVVSAGAAQAQQPEPGDLAMFADAEGTMTTLDVTPGVAFDVFAVAFDVPGGLKAYELGISGVEDLGLFQLGFELFGPAPLNIGSAQDRNFIVGTGACIPGHRCGGSGPAEPAGHRGSFRPTARSASPAAPRARSTTSGALRATPTATTRSRPSAWPPTAATRTRMGA